MSDQNGQGDSQPVESMSALANLIGAEMDAAPEEESEESEEEASGEDAGEQEEPEEQQEQQDDDEAPTVIKHDGKDVSLKKSELIELAQKGFDYSQKTMAVAEERKAIEPIKAEAEKARAEHLAALETAQARLTAYAKFIEGQIGPPPDISLAHQNASYYLALKDAHESQKGKLAQVNAELQATQEETHRQRQAAILAKAKETGDYLIQTLPGWKEAPEKSLNELASYVGKYGLTPDAAGPAYVERGLWELAHKAQQYDVLMADKAKLKPTAQLPRVQKPVATNQPSRNQQKSEAMKAFKANPTSAAALAALL